MLKAVSSASTEGKLMLLISYRLDSALTRQALYTTTRLGIYFSLSDYLKYTVNGGSNMTGW